MSINLENLPLDEELHRELAKISYMEHYPFQN
jgi:hypothetical protein